MTDDDARKVAEEIRKLTVDAYWSFRKLIDVDQVDGCEHTDDDSSMVCGHCEADILARVLESFLLRYRERVREEVANMDCSALEHHQACDHILEQILDLRKENARLKQRAEAAEAHVAKLRADVEAAKHHRKLHFERAEECNRLLLVERAETDKAVNEAESLRAQLSDSESQVAKLREELEEAHGAISCGNVAADPCKEPGDPCWEHLNRALRAQLSESQAELAKAKRNEEQRCLAHAAYNPEGDCVFCDKEQADEALSEAQQRVEELIHHIRDLSHGGQGKCWCPGFPRSEGTIHASVCNHTLAALSPRPQEPAK